MKKIAILGSNKSSTFERIIYTLSDLNLDLICISNKKKSDILIRAKELNIKYNYISSKNLKGYFDENNFDLVIMTDFSGKMSKDIIKNTKFINIHQSLLPAFNCKEPIKKAFLEGVKVSGITIYILEEKASKIITQVPVLINNLMHYDELADKINMIEEEIYPLVIKSILNDEIFDFADLIQQNNSCSHDHHSCGGCSSCCGH